MDKALRDTLYKLAEGQLVADAEVGEVIIYLQQMRMDFAAMEQLPDDVVDAQPAPSVIDEAPPYVPGRNPTVDRIYSGIIERDGWKIDGLELGREQIEAVMRILASDRPVTILTGPAGTGKTLVVRWLVANGHISICGMTGRVSVMVGGPTLDSLFCLNREDLKVWNENLLERNMNNTRRIVGIEEASMLGLRLGDKVFELADEYQKKLLLICDYAQAKPVRDQWPIGGKLLQQADVVRLKEIRRQDDYEYLSVLQQLREGKVSPSVSQFMRGRVGQPKDDDQIVRMYATNKKAEAHNRIRLQAHISRERVCPLKLYARFTDLRPSSAKPRKPDFIEQQLESSNFAHGDNFAIGCQVLITRNDVGCENYVNGDVGRITDIMIRIIDPASVGMEDQTRGQILRLSTIPYDHQKLFCQAVTDDRGGAEVDSIQVLNTRLNRNVGVARTNHEVAAADGKPSHELKGFPLRLGYAVTIHKCQGMTFDRAWLDVGSIAAMPKDGRHGLLYVGVSRTRSPEGLTLSSWEPRLVTCDEEIRPLI